MSLLFSRLTQDFVEFGTILQETTSSNATLAAIARSELPAAAAGFKHSAALNASYLVYIGMCSAVHPIEIAHLNAMQVSVCSCAHTRIWLSGSILARSTRNVSVNDTCSPSFAKISHTLITWVPVRSQRASRPILVSARKLTAPHQHTHSEFFRRLGSTRHV